MTVKLPTTDPKPVARELLALSRARPTRVQLEELWNSPVLNKESNGAIGYQVFVQLMKRLCLAMGSQPTDSWVDAEWFQLPERESIEYKLKDGIQTVETIMLRSLSFALFSKMALALVLQFAPANSNWRGAEAWMENNLSDLRECVMRQHEKENTLVWRSMDKVVRFAPAVTAISQAAANRPSGVALPASRYGQRPSTSPAGSLCTSKAMNLQNSLRPDSALARSPGRLAHPADTFTRPATAFSAQVYSPTVRGAGSTPRSASAGHRGAWESQGEVTNTFKSRPGGSDPNPPYYAHPQVPSRAGSAASDGRLSRSEARKGVNFNIKPQSRLDKNSGVWMPLADEDAMQAVCDIDKMNQIMDMIHLQLTERNVTISLKRFNSVFARVDCNHDGKVDEDELGHGLILLGCPPMPENQLRNIFRQFDQRGCGVDYAELAWLFFQRRQMVHSLRAGDPVTDAMPQPQVTRPDVEFVPPEPPFGELRSCLAAPNLLRDLQAQKKTTPCWMPAANPLPVTGFGASVFAPQSIAPIFYKYNERLGNGHNDGRPAAASGDLSPGQMAERPDSLKSMKEPLPWYKEKQLKQKMQQTADNNGFTQNLRLALHKDDTLDPVSGRQRRFAIAAQRRRVSRIARFTSGNNRHAADYGKAEQEENAVPESVKMLQKQLADAKARKAAGIEDTEEEKAKGHAAGVRVFGKLKKHISKNKSNVATAFNQFDDDNSGALTPSELRECLGSLGIALEDEEFQVMVRLIDSDGDGTIDCGEFMDAVDHYSRLAAGKAARKVARKSGRSKDDLIYLDFAPPRVGIGIESRVPKMRMP